MDLPALANLSIYNGYLPSWLGTTQISAKSTELYPYTLAGKYMEIKAKVEIKCCTFYRNLCCKQP